MKMIYFLALILTIIGSLNWGSVGLLDIDLVKLIFGDNEFIIKFVYLTVGASGLYLMIYHIHNLMS